MRWWNKKNEIKFYGFPNEHLRKKILEKLSRLDIEIKFIARYKKREKINPKEKVDILKELIKDSIFEGKCVPHKIIADKDYFDNKKIAYLIIKNHKEKFYGGEEQPKLKRASDFFQLIEKSKFEKENNYEVVIKIEHKNSRQNPELQAIDLISGAIFQEMENKDKTYTNIIKKHNKIQGIIQNQQLLLVLQNPPTCRSQPHKQLGTIKDSFRKGFYMQQ